MAKVLRVVNSIIPDEQLDDDSVRVAEITRSTRCHVRLPDLGDFSERSCTCRDQSCPGFMDVLDFEADVADARPIRERLRPVAGTVDILYEFHMMVVAIKVSNLDACPGYACDLLYPRALSLDDGSLEAQRVAPESHRPLEVGHGKARVIESCDQCELLRGID